jgi:predicted  nucleic acid-binding Zn-ribbon protein
MKEKLAALFALQQLDSGLDALKQTYAALDPGRAEKAEYDTAKAEHDAADAELHRVTTDLRDTELQQQTLETKRKEVEEKLYSGKVRAPKELMAMQEELEMFGRQRSALDENQLLLIEALEAAKTRLEETKTRLSAAVAAFKEKQAAFGVQTETIRAQARVLVSQRKEAAKQVAPDLMKRYESLRASKNGLAIVALEDGNACGGCKMGLPGMPVQRVLEGNSIELCQNCGRILFAKPE